MSKNSSTPADRNFDDLAHRFQRNIYSSFKGSIRLGILQRDLGEYLFDQSLSNQSLPKQSLPTQSDQVLRVLDAGGGQGQMSVYFAKQGYEVVLCDISQQMLALAEQTLAQENVLDRVTLQHESIQAVLAKEPQAFDVIVCHAVLEWVTEPRALLESLFAALKPGATLSLIYYNLNGLIYKNLLRNNFNKIRQQQWQGHPGSLTPTSPLRPEQVNEWLAELGLETLCESGIRVFHDYILEPEQHSRDLEGVMEMELQHSRLMPFKHLGRYIHVMCRKPLNAA